MGRSVLFVLLAVQLPLSSQAAPPPAKPRNAAPAPETKKPKRRRHPKKTVLVAMRDGTKLATDVFLPLEGKGPWPVMFLRGPYGKNGYGLLLAGAVCKRGYAFVAQDMRGRFESPGSDAVVFHNDGFGKNRDGHDSLEWIARQPWCNGKIATWGGSALGITQTLMAPGAPKALQAQYIRWGTANYYADAVHQGGAFRRILVGGWLKNIKADPETLHAYLKHYKYGPFWDGLNSAAHARRANAPAVYWGGWYDIFCQGTIDSFVAAHNKGGPGARGQCRLIVGPWAHGRLSEMQYPANGKTPPARDPSKRKSLISADALAFFDYHLKGVRNGVGKDKPVHYYVMGDPTDPKAPGNFWRAADNWPPPSTRARFYCHPDGKLVRDAPPRSEGKRTYKFDPKNPVPTLGGQNMIIARGPMDQRKIEARKDVVLFTTTVLKQPLEVTGRISAKLYVSSDCPDTDFTVKLSDVYPDGRSMIVTDGILRARFRRSFEREDFLEPGKIYELTVALSSTSLIFNKGHRIRVAISSSNAPRFDPNPNTGGPLYTGKKTRIATNTIHLSKAHPSHVILPVYTGRTRLPTDPSE
ncbi:MAG: CocE/NonD family hydrolase [Planctomycetaceae bacterium]